jgi:hypothetical protein
VLFVVGFRDSTHFDSNKSVKARPPRADAREGSSVKARKKPQNEAAVQGKF